MAVIPKKLSFQLRFRNKTKTRKILSRDFRLQELLKKDSNNSNLFNYPFVKKEEQQHLLKNPLIVPSLNRSQGVKDTRFVKKKVLLGHFSKDLEDNLLYLGLPEANDFARGNKSHSNPVKPIKFLYIYKKQFFFKSSWFLTNRIKINNNYHIKLKKVDNSNLQLVGNEGQCNTLKAHKFLGTSWVIPSSKNKLLDDVPKPDDIFLKRKRAVSSRPRTNKLLFGSYGICFKQYSIITSKCAETAKLDIAKSLRKKGRSWIRICCDTPVSARPAETRMGKGKGSISYWAARVSPGQFFFEFSGVSLVQLKEIYQKLCKKSAVNLKMVY